MTSNAEEIELGSRSPEAGPSRQSNPVNRIEPYNPSVSVRRFSEEDEGYDVDGHGDEGRDTLRNTREYVSSRAYISLFLSHLEVFNVLLKT